MLISKFGISFLNEEELTETIMIMQESDNIVFDGLHAHIGSQIFRQTGIYRTDQKAVCLCGKD